MHKALLLLTALFVFISCRSLPYKEEVDTQTSTQRFWNTDARVWMGFEMSEKNGIYKLAVVFKNDSGYDLELSDHKVQNIVITVNEDDVVMLEPKKNVLKAGELLKRPFKLELETKNYYYVQAKAGNLETPKLRIATFDKIASKFHLVIEN